MIRQKWIFNYAILLLGIVFLSLTACHREPAYVSNPTYKNLPAYQRQLLVDLEKSGMQVIKQGMQFTFVIPADCFFVKSTRELKSHRGKDLDRLAQFINGYSRYFARPRVTVTGYTDKVWLSPARDLLSMHYAETIAAFLREDAVPSDMITVRGMGAKHPIASNHYPMGTSFNRRVEIVVR